MMLIDLSTIEEATKRAVAKEAERLTRVMLDDFLRYCNRHGFRISRENFEDRPSDLSDLIESFMRTEFEARKVRSLG